MEPGHALVVGNSDGIGLAFTQHLLAPGWSVTGLSRSPSPIDDERYVHHVVDVTEPRYREVLADAAQARGDVDVCAYVAGVGEPLDVKDLAAQTAIFEVNLMGAVKTAEVVVPAMVATGRGHLIGVSSLADVGIFADAPGYAASKAGLSSYFLGLALALRPHGVAVSTVRFGFVDTKMAKAPVKPMMISVDRASFMLS